MIRSCNELVNRIAKQNNRPLTLSLTLQFAQMRAWAFDPARQGVSARTRVFIQPVPLTSIALKRGHVSYDIAHITPAPPG